MNDKRSLLSRDVEHMADEVLDESKVVCATDACSNS